MSSGTDQLTGTVTDALDISNRNSKRLLKYISWAVYVFLYLPILIVIILSFSPQSVPTFPMEGFSLRWYMRLIPPDYDERMVGALVTSLKLGVISAIGAGIVGTLAGMAMGRLQHMETRFLKPRNLNTIFLSPIVVPWIVTGISVLLLYNLLNIQGTFAALVIGHILITIPFVIIIVAAQMYGFDRSLEEAAKNLGANEFRTFYEVTLPLIAPGIIAGMLFAFTISFDNFTQTFFWSTTSTQTLPIVIYSKIRFGLDPTVNAIGTVVVTFSLLLAFIAERLSSRVL